MSNSENTKEKDALASAVDAIVTRQKAYSCEPPFERYPIIIFFAETASKARYKAYLALLDCGFRKSDLEIMDINVRREKTLDDIPEAEGKDLRYAYKNRLKLSAV